MRPEISLFGTDGIRALVDSYPLTPEGVRAIGFAAGKVLSKKSHTVSRQIVIGRDTRESCSWIEKELASGLARSRCEVLSCGVIPTSAISAILREKHFMAGVVISASHNPADFNGIKFFSSSGTKIPDAWEHEIESEIAKAKPLERKEPSVRPYPEGHTIYTRFLKTALGKDFSLEGLRWVMDCANGAASGLAPAVFEALGAEVVALHREPNGRNINLDCGALHTASLRDAVLKFKADGGCAFDGDADRVQFVDEKGRLMDGDILISLAALAMKKSRELSGNCVVTTVMANLGFFQKMQKQKIKVVTTAVGDKAVFQALKAHHAALGGEQSGHIIFMDHLPTGDGLLTALKILSMVREARKKLSHYTDSFTKRPQILVNLKVQKRVPMEKVPRLASVIRAEEKKLAGAGRILVRYSGTEPLLRVMVQGNSLAKIRKAADAVMDSARAELPVEADGR